MFVRHIKRALASLNPNQQSCSSHSFRLGTAASDRAVAGVPDKVIKKKKKSMSMHAWVELGGLQFHIHTSRLEGFFFVNPLKVALASKSTSDNNIVC